MRLQFRKLGISGAALLATIFFGSPPLRAAVVIVDSTGDTIAVDSSVTLREAIASINGAADVNADVTANRSGSYGTNDQIIFLYGSLPQQILNGGAYPAIAKDMSIIGPGIANLEIFAQGIERLFFVNTGINFTVSDVTLRGARSTGGEGGYGAQFGGGGGGGAGMGAAIFVNTGATASVTFVRFFDNVATGGEGGGTGGSDHGGGGGGGFDGNDGQTAVSNQGGNGGAGGDLGGTGGAGSGSTNGGNAAGDGAGGGGAGGFGSPSNGGNGGFAGGGGGQSSQGTGGTGGFGAGGGGHIGAAGAFGGQGAGEFILCGFAGEGGGGGAGLGGAIFVRDGATLNISSCDFDSNDANRGVGGVGDCSTGSDGEGRGGAIFAMDNATVNEDCGSTFENNSADDGDNNIYFLGTITKGDTTDPVITCPGDKTVSNDPGLCSAIVNPGVATATDDCGIQSIVGVRSDNAALSLTADPYPVGATTITWTATDTSGNTAQCTQTITVNDTELPVVSSSVSVTILVNDHTMKNVGYSESATDNCGGNLSGSVLVQIYSSEPEQAPTTGGGDGTTSPDARGRGTCYNSSPWYNQIALRQERLNNGSGRIYLIKTSATDGSNNTGWSCATVVSPRSNKKNDINKVLAAASAVKTVCNQFGAIPTNYYLIGCGPVIGSKQ